MKRYLDAAIVVVVVLVSLPATASADPPSRSLIPTEDFTLEGTCDFRVLTEVLATKRYELTFTDAQGQPKRTMFQGARVYRFTNLATGTSVVRNVSGVGVVEDSGDVTMFTTSGSWLFFFFPGELGPGSEGALFINTGTLLLRLTDTDIEILRQSGSQEDLCATLV
jgi:hypothetical protein